MRQIHIPTYFICNRHLLGEHVEHHMIVGSLSKKRHIRKYVKLGQIYVCSLKSRHDQVALEMVKRGMNHNSPLTVEKYMLDHLTPSEFENNIDIDKNIREFASRCEYCRYMIDSNFYI